MIEQPIGTLRRILFRIIPSSVSENCKVVALGPHSTGALLDLAREVRYWPLDAPGESWRRPIDLISHSATASEDFLSDELGGDFSSFETGIARALAGGKFSRTIMTDDEIATALITELRLRGIDPGIAPSNGRNRTDGSSNPAISIKDDHIAIISEFDTPYGRALPITFARAAGWEKPSQAFSGDHPKWHWFSYAKGLDGRLAAAPTPSSKPGDKEKSGAAKDQFCTPGEIPDGPNQADALRRLTEELRKLDARLAETNRGSIRAIGLMGGDVFDKLWLLRALKPQFPRAVFFTDNLDAWLWQRDELKSTRNLIVISPYGLSLSPKWQMGVPPFRDSYQTSAYAATLVATGMLDPKKLVTQSAPEARIYEIGNQGPHDFSRRSIVPDPLRIQPEPLPLPSAKKFYWIVGIAAAVAGLGLAYWSAPTIGRILLPAKFFPSANEKNPAVRAMRSPPRRRFSGAEMMNYYLTHSFVWIPVIVGICALLTNHFWRARLDEGEPMHFLTGISGLPAQIFRITAILLALHLTGNIWQLLRKNARRLDEVYFGKVERPWMARPRRKSRGRLAGMLRWPLRCWFWSSEAPGEHASVVRPQRLWNRYRRYTGYAARLYRSICIFLVLALVLWLPGATFGIDTIPIRGDSTRHLNTVLDWISSAAFLWITAVVIDAMWTGRMFAYWMTSAPTVWEERAKKYQKGCITEEAACDYLDLKIVAERTQPIVAFAFYPFYILALLILARFECFDHWNWSTGMVVGYTIAIALVLIAAQLLRYEAEKIRHTLIAHLRKEESFPPQPNSEGEILVKEVTTLKTGAFAPISEQPVMKGIYWLISALSIGGLWQYINRVL